LAKFLAAQLTPSRLKLWRRLFFGVLAGIAVLNVVVHNHHPHFGWDAKPLFWPAFGLIIGLALVLVVKKIIQPLIKKSEDYYGDL
jgi:H+/Cl- antiporter ClcA